MISPEVRRQAGKSWQSASIHGGKIPRVSVIIPVYNHARYLGNAIQSVISQSYDEYEIIVVDDGSQDGSREVAGRFGNRIRYVWQKNQGLSAARNTGVQKARAEAIALLDADDQWEPAFLERMMNQLSRNPIAAGVYCGFQYMDDEGHPVGSRNVRVVPPEQFHETLLREGNWLVPCAVVFRKQLASEVGLFDEALEAVEDADLWTRLSVIQPFVGVPEALVRYRRHDGNMSSDAERMIRASYKHTQSMFGPPEGNVSSWSEHKRWAYAKLYRSGARRFLAFGNVAESARHVQMLMETAPILALEMAVWRELARAHLPVEFRNDITSRPDLAIAHKDISSLLRELATRVSSSSTTWSQYSRIMGSAYLALAEEAGRSSSPLQAASWLYTAARNNPTILLSKRFWGTWGRSIATAING